MTQATLSLCSRCNTIQPNPAGAAWASFICANCNPQQPPPAAALLPSTLHVAQPALLLIALWLLLCALSVAAMTAVMVLR